jgi:hypothetical protein
LSASQAACPDCHTLACHPPCLHLAHGQRSSSWPLPAWPAALLFSAGTLMCQPDCFASTAVDNQFFLGWQHPHPPSRPCSAAEAAGHEALRCCIVIWRSIRGSGTAAGAATRLEQHNARTWTHSSEYTCKLAQQCTTAFSSAANSAVLHCCDKKGVGTFQSQGQLWV